MTRVTIKDVSREAEVSVATVSNVLNTPDRVAPRTRERVEAVIDQLGYKPNRAAQALQQQRTSSIGYRMPASSDAFALEAFLHRMVERAGAAGLDIVLFTPKQGESELQAYREMIRRGAIDGFVLSGTGHGDDPVGYLLEVGFPFVTFGRTDVATEHAWVDVDGRIGVRRGVAHLVEAGHCEVALIGWPRGSISGGERAAGYRLGLEDAGLDVRDELIVRTETGISQGSAAMLELLRLDDPPTAVVAVQDLLALGAMRTIRDTGLGVGRDVAVVGFDDIPSAAYADPPLSSVRQPMVEVGALVVEMLVERFRGEVEIMSYSDMVVPELIVRASSQPNEE
jgi:DNA-binding LacI/PurR family transcriptional regulator